MNTNIQLLHLSSPKCTFYTVLTDVGENLYESWLVKVNNLVQQNPILKDDFDQILATMIQFARKFGASINKLRPEKTAFAFCRSSNKIRLYCFVAGDAIILFNGGVKTTQKAQDCPNVGPPFQKAVEYCYFLD